MSKPLTAGALFSGIGGFCLGFENLGVSTSWAVENDPAAVATYTKNITKANVVFDETGPCSIENIGVKRNGLTPVDILHAGFPCQSFSAAGERRGFNDPRGRLFFEIIRLIKEFGDDKPSVLILENSPHLKVGDGGSWFLELQTQIKKAGYWFRESNAFEINSFDYTELPQSRSRLFMVAFSIDAFKNGKLDLELSRSEKPKNLKDYIAFDGEINDDYYYLDEENRYYKMITEKIDDPYCIYQLRKYFVRVKEPGVCPTLTANMGMGGHNVPFIIDKRGLRKLTEKECLNLQGFPRWFDFPDAVIRSKRYQQVGNSVIPTVVEQLAGAVVSKIKSQRQT
jgi:DNA (cytosine-5)-methyltransferase 1